MVVYATEECCRSILPNMALQKRTTAGMLVYKLGRIVYESCDHDQRPASRFFLNLSHNCEVLASVKGMI